MKISYGFEDEVQGIPCQIQLEFIDSDGISFTVWDRKGYRALWLERKMTDKIRTRIEDRIIEMHREF